MRVRNLWGALTENTCKCASCELKLLLLQDESRHQFGRKWKTRFHKFTWWSCQSPHRSSKLFELVYADANLIQSELFAFCARPKANFATTFYFLCWNIFALHLLSAGIKQFSVFIYCLTWAIECISSSSLYRNRKWFICIEWCLSLLMMKLKRFLSSTFDISVQFTNFNVFSFRNLFFFLSQFYCLYNYKWRKRKTHIHIKMQMQIFCG